MSHQNDITKILNELDHSDAHAVDLVLPLVYDELRILARSILSGERPDHTLQSTALVHEAYIRLVDQRDTNWRNRAHFFALASMAIRRILVDHARRRTTQRRGSGSRALSLDDVATVAAEMPDSSLIDLDDALGALATLDEQGARVVEMRYFGGLTNDEIAEVLDVNERTVRRRWVHARAWLYREITGDDRDQQGAPLDS